ncbi:MAG: hypothetical protein ACMUHU_01655 [Thermoplasmatota archaeon]
MILLVVRAVLMGKASEKLAATGSGGPPIIPGNMKSVRTPYVGMVLVPGRTLDGPEGEVSVVPDGNRGAILPEPTVSFWDRKFFISVKGVGARRPMYEDPSWFSAPSDNYPFSSESWFDENPWGAMSRTACLEDAAITELADGPSINGFHICPMVRAEPLPESIMKSAGENYWYRKLDDPGPFYQEFRLLPSDVRLYYQSSSTLGDNVHSVLGSFGIEDVETLDEFIVNYIRSGMAALTLGARTMKVRGDRFTMLDYHDVWLDKDSVIAPDGTLFFADIEGLDRSFPLYEAGAAKLMRTQFHRNFYEFMYGFDRLFRERERMRGTELSWPSRRSGACAIFEMALSGDPFLEQVPTEGSLVMRLRPDIGPRDVELKILDLGGD